jgi:hypothetical protein
MFLLLQVLVNCGLAAVSNDSRKFENVAADNKKLKPFCMQFQKDEAKLHRSDTQGNMPPRWGFLSFGVGGYNDAVPPELKNGSSAAAGTAALIQQQCSPFLSHGKPGRFSNASERS